LRRSQILTVRHGFLPPFWLSPLEHHPEKWNAMIDATLDPPASRKEGRAQ
jgi:hypothetical protein